LVGAQRKCLTFYFYFLDNELGLIHVRIPTWFPMSIQVCLNGHEILARKLDHAKIEYRKEDNAFTWIADIERAQRLADRIPSMDWPKILNRFAQRINPLLGDVLQGMGYYWVTDQAEYATDVMFESPAALKPLYDKWVKHAITYFTAEDVLRFLGKKLQGNFKGEVLSDWKNKRWPGARIKHRVKENWIKMYDKHGCVLRIESVINQPREFRVRREGTRMGEKVVDWFPMRKGVANLYRYAEVARGANHRYLEALSAVEPPRRAVAAISRLARRVRAGKRSFAGFNPALAEDIALFAAVLCGEHAIHGISNEAVRCKLYGSAVDPTVRRRHANRVSRLFKRLHVHGLITKVRRSRRWRLTKEGTVLVTAVLKCHYEKYPELLAALAI
jgi:hypothetical protein